MKKIFALLLGALTIATMPFAAFAASTPIDGEGAPPATNLGAGEYSINVTGSYDPTATASVISVDVAWDELAFDYKEGSNGTWDPSIHDYVNAESGGWLSLEPKKISVTNHSNIDISANIDFETNDSDLMDSVAFSNKIEGGSLFKKLARPDNFSTRISSAVGTTADAPPSVDIYVGPKNSSLAAIKRDTLLGTFTISLRKAEVTVSTYEELLEAVKYSGTVKLANDITGITRDYPIELYSDITIDLNGHKIQGDFADSMIRIELFDTFECTIKNGTIENTCQMTPVVKNYNTVFIEDCTLIANGYTPLYSIGGNNVLKNCTLEGDYNRRSVTLSDYDDKPSSLEMSGNINMSGIRGVDFTENSIVNVKPGKYNIEITACGDPNVMTNYYVTYSNGIYTVEEK